MLVCILDPPPPSSSLGCMRLICGILENKINSLDHATDLAFNLTESPWIRAGRQYSVRVSPSSLSPLPPPTASPTPYINEHIPKYRTYGRTRTTAPLFATSEYMMSPRMGWWLCCCRMQAMSQRGHTRLVRCWSGV